MRHPRWLLPICLGILLVIVAVAVACNPPAPIPQIPLPNRDMGEDDAPAKPVWAGVYEFLDFNVRDVTAEREWKVGSQYRFNWNTIETADQVFDWTDYDTWAQAAADADFHVHAGTLPFAWSPGEVKPNDGIFLPSDLLDAGDEGTYYFECPTTGGDHRIPKFWSAEYQTQIDQLAAEIAAHLADDPQGQLADVWEMMLGDYNEASIANINNTCILAEMSIDSAAGDLDYLGLPGLCPADVCGLDDGASIWAQVQVNFMVTYHDAFAAESVTIPIVAMLQPYAFRNWEREILSAEAATLGIMPRLGRALFDGGEWITNGMFGQYDVLVTYQETLYGGGEMEDFMNETVPTAPTDLTIEERAYWSTLNAIDKHLDAIYINFYSSAITSFPYTNTQVAESLTWFSELAGTTASDAPFVMNAMRETQWTAGSSWSQCGDFDFYLYHDMCTYVDKNNNPIPFCPTVFNPPSAGCSLPVYDAISGETCSGDNIIDPDCDPRGRYARRTKASNPYMYYNVDANYAYGMSTGWIEITFDDTGTDRIGIRYDNGDTIVNDTIAKTNTGTWRTYTFTLTADLSDVLESNNDFAVTDFSDGYDTVHLVRASFTSSGSPTATAVPANTATPVPEATATPVPEATATPVLCPTMAATIDGNLAEWSGRRSQSLSAANAQYTYPAATPSAADLSAKFWLGCSGENLLMAGVVTDTLIFQPEGDLTNGDAMEILIDGLADGLTRPGQDDHDLFVAPDGRARDYLRPLAATVVARTTPGSNWRFELSMPRSAIWTTLTSGDNIDVTLGLWDRDAAVTPTPGAPAGPDQVLIGPRQRWTID